MVYVLCLPYGWTDRSPLLWDQAGHFLDALRFYRGLTWGEPGLIRTSLLGPDQYPPLHSVLLGSWMVIAGHGAAAWFTFGLVVHAATAYLLARIHPVAALIFVASPLLGGLAPTLMVEPVACLLLVAALLAFPGASAGAGRSAGFAFLAALLILTKYNIGLPLLPAALLAAVVRPRRSVLVRTALAVGAALAVWALYLSLQDSGWAMFREFSRNRSNSAGAGFGDRMVFYWRVLKGMFLTGPTLAVGVVLAAVAGLVPGRLRDAADDLRFRRTVLAMGYLVFSLAALGRHEYQLSRNLTGPAMCLMAAAGWGLAALPPGRQAFASLVLVVMVGIGPLTFAGPYRRCYVENFYPAGASRLDPVSGACDRLMAEPGRTRIVGTFNEFSPAWVKILAMRSESRNPLAVSLRCPRSRSRMGIDPAWIPAYAESAKRWAEDGTRRVMVITVAPDSPYRSRDYELWNAWKLNLVRALEDSPAFSATSGDSLECGVGWTVFTLRPGADPGL